MRHAGSLLAASLLAACASHPRPVLREVHSLAPAAGALAGSGVPQRPENAPAPDRGKPEQDGGPVIDGPIGLARVLVLVAERGIDQKIAMQYLALARAQRRVAESAWIPTLSIGGRYWRNEGRVQSTEGLFLDVDKQNAFLGGELLLSLDLAEALNADDAARARERAAGHAAAASAADARALAAEFWFDLVEAQAMLSIAEESIQHAEELLAVQDARVEAGAGLPADLSRARAFLARRLGEQVRAVRRLQSASLTLTELLQLDGARGLRATELATPEPRARAPLGDLLERARQLRPELAAVRARTQAAAWERRAAREAWILPTLEASASTGSFGEDFDDLEDKTVYAAGLTWHIGARLFGALESSAARLRVSELEQQRAEGRVDREVLMASFALDASTELLEATASELHAAEDAVQLARARYEEGAGLLIEVLEAEVSRQRARLAATAAEVGVHQSQHQLARAVGEFSPRSD